MYMEPNSKVVSVDQDKWCDIVEAIRSQLEKHIPDIPIMKPAEVGDLIAAFDRLNCLELDAQTRDERLEKHRVRQQRQWDE